MFKPQNPEFNILVEKLEYLENKKQKTDNKISEIQPLIDDLHILKEEISSIETQISFLIKEKEEKSKELNRLQSLLNSTNKIELENISKDLDIEIKDTNKKIKEILNIDFKSFIHSMTKENTIYKYLSPTTPTTPIMDEFANSKDKDFLVLSGIFYDKNLVITKKQRNIIYEQIDAPTMTELKTYKPTRIPERMKPLLDTINKYRSKKLKSGEKIQFDVPFPLGGQTYENQTGYGWEWDWTDGYGDYIEGTYYGEVTTFFIIGFIEK